MKMVIDIPEEEYEEIISSEDCGLHTLTRAVANGTPLPPKYGRLVDADRLEQIQNDRLQNGEIKIWELKLIVSALNAAETVVEADGGAE